MSSNIMALTGKGPSSSGPTAAALQRLMKASVGADRSMISMSDDSVMMKQIVETHSPDGLEVDVKPLFLLVDDILNRATLTVETVTPGMTSENVDEKVHQIMLDALSYTIERLSCELESKGLGSGDAHATTVFIFKILTSFPWDAKLVLTLAAFAFNYGEFWLLIQTYSSNHLAKSMAIMKQLPTVMEHPSLLKPRLDALNKIIQAMLEVTRCVIELKDLPSVYISTDFPALVAAVAHVPTAVYWTIRSAVACTSQITSLTYMGHEYVSSTAESWELSTLEHKLINIAEHLKKQIYTCNQHIEEKKHHEYFDHLRSIFEATHIDNLKVLRALIYRKGDIQPLVDGSTKTRVNIDVLRRKTVLLLISGLDISTDELSILEQIQNEAKLHATKHENPYEVVWIPIVDKSVQWTEPMETRFESLRATMPWYSVYHPNLVEEAVIQFIKEVWHFKNKPILVVLDPQGKVVSPNAIHMMWIWGSNAYPFTTLREEMLWRDETWKLDLIVDGIDPIILNWIQEGKYIFVYGGVDIEWIRKFTTSARQVAAAARIPLEMVYVGKSGKKEQVRQTTTSIKAENLSHCWDDPAMVWFFWTRLESMFFSKIQLGKVDDHDLVMQGIKKLLSYDRTGGWAVLARGSSMVVNGHSNTILPALIEYDIWKGYVPAKGYDLAFKDHHDRLHDIGRPCCRFEFPTVASRIPDRLKCPECERGMEKVFSFICCHDDSSHVPSFYEQ